MAANDRVAAEIRTDEDELAQILWAYDEQLLGAATTKVEPRSTVTERFDRRTWRRLEESLAVVDLLSCVGPRLVGDSSVAEEIARGEPAQPGASGAVAGELAVSDAALAAGRAGLPRRIARFELVRELGRGGLGVVFLAEDPLLHRRVALKVPLPGALLVGELRNRFDREARAAARLTHPNVVQVYEIGEAGPIRYIASAFCDGPTLAEWMRQQPGPVEPRTAAELVAALADGVDYAHSQNVLHRDLKPSNVILQHEANATQEPLALPFSPRITDFGLARVGDAPSTDTRSGVVMGTPAYMAPEQAAGRTESIGREADIYALGGMLYEMLTGQPPFRGAHDADILRQVVSDEPVAPRRRVAEVPRDLEAICLKCLEKSPAARYATAGDLAADLRRWLAGEPTTARPLGRAALTWRVVRRHPAVSLLSGMLVLLLLAMAIGGTASAVLIHGSLRQAEQSTDREREARSALSSALVAERAERKRAEEAEVEAERAAAEAALKSRVAQVEAQFLMDLFRSSDPTGLGGMGFRRREERAGDTTALELLTRGRQRLETSLHAEPLERAALATCIGSVYRSLGHYNDAADLLEEGLTLRRAHLQPPHADLAQSAFEYAWLLHDTARYEEAIGLYREALEMQRAVLGEDSLEVATTEFNLAWCMLSMGDGVSRDEIERHLNHALLMRKQHLGQQHREVAITLAAIAGFELWAGRPDAARSHITQSLLLMSAQPGGDVLVKALLTYQWAAAERQSRRYAQAERLLREALAQVRSYLGDDHPAVALVLGDLAGLLREHGKYAEAEACAREAIASGLGFLPSGHPELAIAMVELADVLRDRGDHDEAGTLYADALSMARRLRGDEDLLVARILERQSHWYRFTGRPQESLEAAQTAAAVAIKANPPAWGLRWSVAAALADAHLALGQVNEAERIWLQEMAAVEADEGPTSGWAREMRSQWLWFRELWHDDPDARAELRQVFPPPAPDAAAAPDSARQYCERAGLWLGIGRLLMRDGQTEEAIRWLDRSYHDLLQHACPGSWQIAQAAVWLGAALGQAGRHSEAELLLIEGCQRLTLIRGDADYLTVEARQYLANHLEVVRDRHDDGETLRPEAGGP